MSAKTPWHLPMSCPWSYLGQETNQEQLYEEVGLVAQSHWFIPDTLGGWAWKMWRYGFPASWNEKLYLLPYRNMSKPSFIPVGTPFEGPFQWIPGSLWDEWNEIYWVNRQATLGNPLEMEVFIGKSIIGRLSSAMFNYRRIHMKISTDH